MEIEHVKKAAVGKWIGVFQRLGIQVPLPPGNHGPCPTCGGKDRFRLDKMANDDGGWFCNQCDPKAGDGIALVRNVLSLDLPGALKSICDIAGIVDASPMDPAKAPQDPTLALNALWVASTPLNGHDPASKYLQSRGLTLIPNDVRFCKKAYEPETKKEMWAMIAKVTAPENDAISIHRTFLEGVGKAKIKSPRKYMPPKRSLNGVALRLFKPDSILGIAEGIETAIYCTQELGVPTWAAGDAQKMETWVIPKGLNLDGVVIFGDNDSSKTYAGQKAAYILANKLAALGVQVDVKIPPNPGDWLDLKGRSRG